MRLPNRNEMTEIWKSIRFSFSFKAPNKPNMKDLNLFYRAFRFVIADDVEKAHELGWKKLIIAGTITIAMFSVFLYLKYMIFFG